MADRLCEFEGCDKKHYAKGLCNAHYNQKRRESAPPCIVEGCENHQRRSSGLCSTHYNKKLKESAPTCTEEGCENPQHAKGLCHTHYKQRRLESAPTCTEEGCENPQHAKGLCHTHYKQKLKESAPTCTEEGCENPQHAKGLCHTHYKQNLRGAAPPCIVEGCENPQESKGLCQTHRQHQRAGMPLKPIEPRRGFLNDTTMSRKSREELSAPSNVYLKKVLDPVTEQWVFVAGLGDMCRVKQGCQRDDVFLLWHAPLPFGLAYLTESKVLGMAGQYVFPGKENLPSALRNLGLDECVKDPQLALDVMIQEVSEWPDRNFEDTLEFIWSGGSDNQKQDNQGGFQ